MAFTKEQKQAHYAANREKRKEESRWRHKAWKYGISKSEYEALWAQQDGLCAICFEPETTVIRGRLIELSVDHNHQTGQIRGLLCASCNNGLGRFQDNIDRIRNAANYLERTSNV